MISRKAAFETQKLCKGMKVIQNTFKKEERLKSRKLIQGIFSKSQTVKAYPLRLLWIEREQDDNAYPVLFSLSVPKRKFKKAVHRNWLRRRVREAYRLNKSKLYQSLEGKEEQYAFMVLYTSPEPLPFQEIEVAMRKLLERFVQAVDKAPQKRKRQ